MVFTPIYIDFERYKQDGDMVYKVFKPTETKDEAMVDLVMYAFEERGVLKNIYDYYLHDQKDFFDRFKIPKEERITELFNFYDFKEVYEVHLISRATIKDLEQDGYEKYDIIEN